MSEIVDIGEPAPGEIDRLLDLMDHPIGTVVEDPIDILRTRTVLTVREFARVMHVGRSAGYALIRSGRFPTMRVGADGRGIRVLAQPLARMLGDTCPTCGAAGRRR